ncbi:RUS family member 1 isoform X4 [Podarcis raffonei]|uniref:RUS family member 1 isoform X4 n=1 Tax=Podarcis raffonei TaxID=65483 RepID=UPI0023292DE4|nr:RUS family member 1 isoform X4 [Podarcis raffonei]
MTNLGVQPLCMESYGSRSAQHYRALPDGRLACIPDGPQNQGFRSLREIFMLVFLPQGYPESVSSDYLAYQIWDTVQMGLGCWAELSLPGVRGANWTVMRSNGGKEGCFDPNFIGVLLSNCMSKIRLFADVLNDMAILMEILAPAFPACFTLIVCISGFFKCIVGVAGGATRAALTMHQARRDNMADVSAKDGSQETLVNLAGLFFSLLLIPLVADNLRLTYSLYGLFTALHLYANYRAVRSICMETLNRARLRLVLRHFLQRGKVLGPALANPQEPLVPGFQQQLRVNLGTPLHTVASRVADFQKALEGNATNHLIFVSRAAGTVSILLHRLAGSVDVIKACTHAFLLEVLLYQDVTTSALEEESLLNLQRRLREEPENKDSTAISETHQLLDKIFPRFLAGLTAAGWVTDRNLLGPDEWRMDWTIPEKKTL